MLPGTCAVLQADNYGIQFRDLYKHLNHLAAYLTEQEPPKSLTENFQNPYTGQTTAQILAAEKTLLAEAESEASTVNSKAGFFSSIATWFKSLLGK